VSWKLISRSSIHFHLHQLIPLTLLKGGLSAGSSYSCACTLHFLWNARFNFNPPLPYATNASIYQLVHLARTSRIYIVKSKSRYRLSYRHWWKISCNDEKREAWRGEMNLRSRKAAYSQSADAEIPVAKYVVCEHTISVLNNRYRCRPSVKRLINHLCRAIQ